jgi:hypothetical protein
VRLPDGRAWLRLADPEWTDPLDTSYAAARGGRWNPPRSYSTLYLNADFATARFQLARMLAGSPVHVDDLDDGAFVLVAATLPRAQVAADAVSPEGLGALGLPASYPRDPAGGMIDHAVCQQIGNGLHEAGVRGVWCRSACTPDGHGRELAWFPATTRSRAHPLWHAALPLGIWRHAGSEAELEWGAATEPRPV